MIRRHAVILLVSIALPSIAGCADDGARTEAVNTVAETTGPIEPTVPTTAPDPVSSTTEPTTTEPTTTTEPAATTDELSVRVEVVPMPGHVTEVQLPWWTADGESLVLSARSTEFDGMQLVRVDPDGSDFACLTCEIAAGEPPLMKPIPFDDGRRVLVRIGNQTPFTNGEHAVLECTPSVSRCDAAELVPIIVPVDDLVVQPQREFRVAPGGDRVGFTQMRANDRNEPTYVSIVAELQRVGEVYELVDPRAISSRGELKQFSPDGSTVYVSSFIEGPEAGNGDVLEVDLATGDEQRITWYPDYDEPVESSPDGKWLAIGSARTAGVFEPIAQVQRPNMLTSAISPLALHLFNTYRDELLEPWLITVDGERAGELGLLLNPGSVDAGWEGRMIPNWNRDGRRIVFWEAAIASTAGSADAGSRVVVATLDGLETPGSAPTPRRPDLSWAPPLADFSPPAPPLPASRNGNASGSIEVAVAEGETLTISITYRDFSDDGEWVIDGSETITNTGGATGSVTYVADLTVGGEHSGYLRAIDVDGSATGGFTGRIESEVDGRSVELKLG
jgi:hypothetical protein